MAPHDEWYYSAGYLGKEEVMNLDLENGSKALFELFDGHETTIDFTALRYASNAAELPPQSCKLVWKAPEGVQLDHELSRIVFATREIGCRFNIFFADRQRLRGGEGSVALASHFTHDFFDWLRTFGASKVSADFYIVSAAPPIHIEAVGASKARDSLAQHAQNDFMFLFPSQQKAVPSRCLWSKKGTLVQTSSYFKTFFQAEGFSEATEKLDAPKLAAKSLEYKSEAAASSSAVVQGKAGDKDTSMKSDDGGTEATTEFEHEDSDLENDYFPSPSPSPSITRIVVHGVAYKTLYSYLYFLETSTIQFEPLSSLFSSPRTLPPFDPSAFPTCSPKSMYRLSKFYEHQALRELSYNSIATQLDGRNALVELFSDLSSDFEEIKALCFKAVLDNWDYIKQSKGMKDIEEDLKKGNMEERKVGLVFELFSKLNK